MVAETVDEMVVILSLIVLVGFGVCAGLCGRECVLLLEVDLLMEVDKAITEANIHRMA